MIASPLLTSGLMNVLRNRSGDRKSSEKFVREVEAGPQVEQWLCSRKNRRCSPPLHGAFIPRERDELSRYVELSFMTT